MYNDILALMRKMGVRWTDALEHGVSFLRSLRDTLWYIDGHHDTIADRTPKIPEVFASFVGYKLSRSSQTPQAFN